MDLFYGTMYCDSYNVPFTGIKSLNEFMDLLLKDHPLERKCREAMLYRLDGIEVFHITGEELVAMQRDRESRMHDEKRQVW